MNQHSRVVLIARMEFCASEAEHLRNYLADLEKNVVRVREQIARYEGEAAGIEADLTAVSNVNA